MSGVTMVMKAPHHIPTGLQGSQARKTEMKIVSLWFQEMEFIRVNGTSNDAMNKMSLFVGKQFETIQHLNVVASSDVITIMASLLEAMEEVGISGRNCTVNRLWYQSNQRSRPLSPRSEESKKNSSTIHSTLFASFEL